MSQILECTSFTHIFLLLVSTTCLADSLEGKVVRIVGGDTLVILDDNKTQHRVRLAGIDTPELESHRKSQRQLSDQELLAGGIISNGELS